jgi:hypothetical protein
VDRPPPVPLPRPSPHQTIPRALPNLPGRSGRPKNPQSPRALVSEELLRRGCGRHRLCWLEKGTEASRPIPAVHLRSDGSILNSSSPILAAHRRSNGPGPLPPHPAPALPAGPACQPARARAARWPRLSARPRPRCPLAPPDSRPRPRCPLAPPISRSGRRALARPPADLILRVDLRSDGRRSPIPLRPRVFLKRPPVFWNLTRRPWILTVRSSDLLFNSK